MLISEKDIEIEYLTERHLYEKGYIEVSVNIHIEYPNVEMFIKADDKALMISMYDDDFENEDHFYDYVFTVLNERLK